MFVMFEGVEVLIASWDTNASKQSPALLWSLGCEMFVMGKSRQGKEARFCHHLL